MNSQNWQLSDRQLSGNNCMYLCALVRLANDTFHLFDLFDTLGMELHHVLELVFKFALVHFLIFEMNFHQITGLEAKKLKLTEFHDIFLAALEGTGFEFANLDLHLNKLGFELLLLCLQTSVFRDL